MKLAQFISSLGLDLTSPHLKDTPARVERHLRAATANQNKRVPQILRTFSDDCREWVQIDGIEFSSLCCHHLMPFFGSVSVGYLPSGRIVGLSKFARAVAWLSKRAQTQEQLTRDLAHLVSEQSGATRVTVEIKALHTCMACRGTNQRAETTTRTSLATNESKEWPDNCPLPEPDCGTSADWEAWRKAERARLKRLGASNTD
jgi:GTP cyclohydrolase IA